MKFKIVERFWENGKFIAISKELKFDFDSSKHFYFIIEIFPFENKYMCVLSVVLKHLEICKEVKESFCETYESISQLRYILDCYDYGLSAHLDSLHEPNFQKSYKVLRETAIRLYNENMVETELDRPHNGIGNDGWDFLTGKIGIKEEGCVRW
jgi:hypothetical protein